MYFTTFILQVQRYFEHMHAAGPAWIGQRRLGPFAMHVEIMFDSCLLLVRCKPQSKQCFFVALRLS